MGPISGFGDCAARLRMHDALAPLLVASPGSGPPGSPNLLPKVFGRASRRPPYNSSGFDRSPGADAVLRRSPRDPGPDLLRSPGPGARLPGTEWRGQVDRHADPDRLPGPELRFRERGRLRPGRPLARGATPYRLPARDGAPLQGDARRELPRHDVLAPRRAGVQATRSSG